MDDILKHYPEISGIHPACLAVPSMTDEEYAELLKDVMVVGLCHAIVLTEDKLLLDGRNRLRACYDAMVEPRFTKTGVDPWIYVNSANIQRRHLTTGQKAMFGQAMLEHEKAKAKERQQEAGKSFGRGQEGKVPATLPDAIQEKGDSRDKVAAAVGVGGKAIDKAAKIVQHAPDLAEKVKQGEMDLEPAYQKAKEIEKQKQSLPIETIESKPAQPVAQSEQETTEIFTVSGKSKQIPKPKTVKFNRTTDSVDWAKWTWNPVTGCNHGCSFCYAREIANSQRMEPYYPFKFEPTFHPYRLEAPSNTSRPSSEDPREGRVFVCSMADLFGKWVPEEWIQQVFDACLKSPEWEYLFLTKWPSKYSQMPLLENAWYGASVVTQSDVSRIESAMQNFDTPNAIKWVSMEPMLGAIQFNDLSWCDLVVIGSQTSTNQPEGPQPEIPANFDHVVDVVNQCREWGVPYYLKANLGLDRPGMKLPKMSPNRGKTLEKILNTH